MSLSAGGALPEGYRCGESTEERDLTEKDRIREGFLEEEMSEKSPQMGSEPGDVGGRDVEGF